MSSPARARLRLGHVAALGTLVLLLAGCPASQPPDDGDGGGSDPPIPTVSSTQPDDGATAAVATDIVVVFSEEMNATATEGAFDVSPAITCDFGWSEDGTTVTCDPDGGLARSQAYTVTIDGSATSAAGAALEGGHSFSFSTVGDGPAVLGHTPDDGASGVFPNQSIEIRFSERMDAGATEAAVDFEPSVTCSFAWNAEGTDLTCDPDSDLAADTEYTVTVGAGATDASGVSMVGPYAFGFRTGVDLAPRCEFGASEFGACVFGP